MAQLIPAPFPADRKDNGMYRELDVLEVLRAGLPQPFLVFHSLPLHSLSGERDQYGEIDIAVLAPNGALLLLEVKAGELVQRNGSLFKVYRDMDCDVARQLKFQHGAMVRALREAGLQARVLNCLVLPDYHLQDAPLASFPRERVVDAGNYASLATLVRQWMQTGEAQADFDKLQRMLRNQFQVVADISVLREQVAGAARRLADGLATWVPRMSAPSRTFHIQATAGSGKTQLALRLLADAAAQGQRAAYICFNRALADRVRQLVSARIEVATFHELCTEHYRSQVGEPDFSSPRAFALMEENYLATAADSPARYDLLVIDEAQDFNPDWLPPLCSQVRGNGRLYVMEDDNQRLFGQEPFDLPEAVRIECSDNFRSPRAICSAINAFGLAQPALQAVGPYQGELPQFLSYRDDAGMLAQTKAAVAALRAQGFALEDIAILSGRGRNNSALLAQQDLGGLTLRRFTGAYDQRGEPVWSEGVLLAESVGRFKGLSAPAIVATEFDFDELDESNRRKLFVALTRAQMAAVLVLSERAEASLALRLQQAGQP
ncbi:AAA family ATPase [Massilia sp. SR12]